jgi:hypothetical protein
MKKSNIGRIAGVLVTAAICMGASTSGLAALSASATFTVSGGNLVVTLVNTSPDDVLVPTDVLTGVFFDINGVGALTPSTAILGGGSIVYNDPEGQPAGGNVGGEWAYASGLVGAPLGATEGIMSSGLGLFGNGNFNGPNLDGPTAVNGGGYGIVSAGDNVLTGNTPVTTEPLIKNSVVFTLTGLPAGWTTADLNVSNIFFQYGTALAPVPEPSTIVAGALLLLPFGISTLRFIRKQRAA